MITCVCAPRLLRQFYGIFHTGYCSWKKQIVIGHRVRNSRDWQRVDPEFKKRVLGISVCVLGCSCLVWSDGGGRVTNEPASDLRRTGSSERSASSPCLPSNAGPWWLPRSLTRPATQGGTAARRLVSAGPAAQQPGCPDGECWRAGAGAEVGVARVLLGVWEGGRLQLGNQAFPRFPQTATTSLGQGALGTWPASRPILLLFLPYSFSNHTGAFSR